MKVLEQIPASLCIDIGHLWRDGRDALPYLEAYLGRARVVHLHGVGERDHQSLELTAPEGHWRKTMNRIKADASPVF